MKILLIEDDCYTRELISATLLTHRYAVDAIADGKAGLDLATQWTYDLILLDLLLPDLNGIEVCRRLRAQNCQTPVLMLTQKDTTEDIVAGLDAGADDYLAKSSDSAQLLARVRALLRRSRNVSSSPLLTWGLLCLDPAAARVTYNQTAIALRPKEYALLELFLRYPHRVFSRSAVIDHLWSIEATPVEGVITNLIKDLRQRLKAAGLMAELIETVYGLGYRLREAPEGEEVKAEEGTLGTKAAESRAVEGEADGMSQFHLTHHDVSEQLLREQRGKAAIEEITNRFQGSLTHRVASLEAAERSLQSGSFSLAQRQATRIEAHKLAGGLGTFGNGNGSDVAQAIADLLEANIQQEMLLMQQLPQLLEDLKQALSITANSQ